MITSFKILYSNVCVVEVSKNVTQNADDGIKIYFKQDLCHFLPTHTERRLVVSEVFRMIDFKVYARLKLSNFVFTQKQAIYLDYRSMSLDSKHIKSMYRFLISLFKKPNPKTKACGCYCMIYSNLEPAHRVCREMKSIRRHEKSARLVKGRNHRPTNKTLHSQALASLGN